MCQTTSHRHSIFCILPPQILRSIAENGTQQQRETVLRTLSTDTTFRALRASLTPAAGAARRRRLPALETRKQRTIYTANNVETLPGTVVRSEGSGPSGDAAVDEAYDGLGNTFDFYERAYDRNSIDDEGLPLDATVHYGQDYDNAFWNGQRMVFGDGDGQLFNRFTISLDVIGHELTHGVTEDEAGLVYMFQPGALNESISDVFGELVEQMTLNQTASQGDWLIGAGLFTANVNGVALRSMKDPGTAYDDPVLGKDPQPGHMRDYVRTNQDNGRRAHQLRHPQPRVLPGGDRDRRLCLGEGRPDLVRGAPPPEAAAQRAVPHVRLAYRRRRRHPLRDRKLRAASGQRRLESSGDRGLRAGGARVRRMARPRRYLVTPPAAPLCRSGLCRLRVWGLAMAAAMPLCSAVWLGEASGAEAVSAMRVIFTSEGGVAFFPGLSRPVAIDAATLTVEERNELDCLIDEAGFFALPSEAGKPAKGAADYRRYTITVEEQGRRHTVKASDPLADPKLRNLIGFLQRKVREMRQPAKP